MDVGAEDEYDVLSDPDIGEVACLVEERVSRVVPVE